jgi:ubiquinone/menaquinone biosynthesis C-methylase UbiE
MKGLTKHLGIVTHIKELRFKSWLNKNAFKVLAGIGVTAGQVLLDFGCGSGTYTIPAAKLVGEGGRVYAIDINEGAIKRMEKMAEKEGLKNIVRIDASTDKAIPLSDKVVDVILLIDVLQEIDEMEALFAEVHRVLKQCGIMCVYPMHIGEGETIRLAASRGFTLKGKKIP